MRLRLPEVTAKKLWEWIEEDEKGYLVRTLRGLDKKRFVEFTESSDQVEILPAGAEFVRASWQQLTSLMDL